jgi:hypothetical protein
MLALGHLAVGVLGHHDGAVDQHADGEDQAKQHHHIDREPQRRQHQDGGEERTRHRQPDQPGAAQAQGGDHHDHHQQHGADDVVLQVAQHVPDVVGAVLRVGHLDPSRPLGARRLDHGPHPLDGLDDVLAGSLRHLQRDRRPAVQPREALRVLEGAPHLGHVAHPHRRVATHLDRHVEDVGGAIEHAGHLDGETTPAGVERTGGDEPVGAGHGRRHIVRRDAVALKE